MQVPTMSETTNSESEHADKFRKEVVECDNGREVDIEEYPGGDMSIFTDRSELYLTSEEAAALRTSLGRIDADKAADTAGEDND